ncbi:MAG: DMT family transporter [Candidatus Pelethousia sp.]|nr:DMT family transporter [Candidatus Pelethousia sp.]
MMSFNERTRRNLANCMLLLTGALWGGGFVVMKNALDSISTNYLLAIRFTMGALGLSYSLFSKKHPLEKRTLLGGLVTGFFLYTAFAAQTYGLMFTTAGKNALITAVYVVLVPLLVWLWKGLRPSRRIMLAALFMLLGIALLSLDGESGVNVGDMLTLLCGILYAMHICAVDTFADRDVMQLTCLQFAFAAAFSWLGALAFETFPSRFTPAMVGELAYCGICATLLALTMMNIGIKYASPTYASLFMSTESAFGCLFGVIFLKEAFTGRMAIGCLLILGALVLSQLPEKKVAAMETP